MTGIATLRQYLARNRFMPVPPPDLIFCGDGDFRAIGAEFLEHLVEDAGLQPHERVLDLGCGIGRLALPLSQYLDESGLYEGIDPVAQGIAWCQSAITPFYPNIRFQHLDLQHPLYNPEGAYDTATTPLPFDDDSFDLITMISVLTHLDLPELLHYAAEARRLLAPGGRLFATAFLMNPPAREALEQGLGRMGFDAADPGPVWQSDKDAPLAGVAIEEDVFLEKFLRHNLVRRNPAQYGHWSGRPSATFQDICIFDRVD